MKKLREDLDNLMKDIKNFIVEKNQTQFINPLRYRLNLLDEKFERIRQMSFSNRDDREFRKIEKDLQFCKDKLN